MARRSPTTVVIGLGNPILRDDGVGIEVVRRLHERLGEAVAWDEDTDGGLRLVERMIGFERALVIDAILAGGRPGELFELRVGELPTAHSGSSHDMGLPSALALVRATGARVPDDEHIRILGVQVADLSTFGEVLTGDVAAAIPRAVDRAARIVATLDDSTG